MKVLFIGGTGLHRIDWAQRQFEIGYWCRSSRVGEGFVTSWPWNAAWTCSC